MIIMPNPEYPGFIRKHPAHHPPVHRHNQPTILHVSVCTSPRRDILATEPVHVVLRRTWTEARRWRVGYYVVMPDHRHLFCAPGTWLSEPVKKWCTYWKRQAARYDPLLKGCWEQDCWDTQMRTVEHYERKLEYVRRNPVRAAPLYQRPTIPSPNFHRDPEPRAHQETFVLHDGTIKQDKSRQENRDGKRAIFETVTARPLRITVEIGDRTQADDDRAGQDHPGKPRIKVNQQLLQTHKVPGSLGRIRDGAPDEDDRHIKKEGRRR